jgi:hypothetical protein
MATSYIIPKSTSFDLKVISGINHTFQSSATGISPEIPQLQDFRSKLNNCFRTDTVELGETSDTESTTARESQSERYFRYRVQVLGVSTKPLAFEQIRQRWCTEICKPGDPFWLGSSESSFSTFQYKVKTPIHRLQPSSFSFGSFYGRGTFIEHYNTKGDINFIEKEGILSKFEHDTEQLTLTIALKRPCPSNCTTFRVEFVYKQFEEYVLVDENKKFKTIDLYVPMIRPPIVKKKGRHKYEQYQFLKSQ